MMHLERAVAGLVALVACAVSACAPRIDDPELFGVDQVEIHGEHFGGEGRVLFGDGSSVSPDGSVVDFAEFNGRAVGELLLE